MAATLKKGECERAIRHLCHVWRQESGLANTPAGDLSFTRFLSWVQQSYPAYLIFRTSTLTSYDVEMWFDQEFKQTWRN